MHGIARLLLLAVLLPLSVAMASPAGLFDHPLPSALPQPLRTIRQQFEHSEVLKLQFHQKRWLPELQQPLVSTGTLTMVPSLGLEWRIDQPFPSTWRITRDGRVLEGPDNPGSEAVAQLLMSLLSVNTAGLKSAFSLYWLQQSSQWWLGLQPRDQRLQRVLDSIVVSGDKALRHVEVRENSGDRTEIDFTSMQTGTLTEALRARFQAH